MQRADFTVSFADRVSQRDTAGLLAAPHSRPSPIGRKDVQ